VIKDMTHLLSVILISSLLCIFSTTLVFSAEENFLLVNGNSGASLLEVGPHIDERVTPCSTFKVALSLMGFDSGILQDENSPIWLFQEGYDDSLESWKNSQTPRSWMKNSCVWFSRILTARLGMQKFEFYLAAFDYGNQDASGGLTKAWLSSSLKISTREQVAFIQKILHKRHPVSPNAIDITRQILFLEELPNGWKLFGKTGWAELVKTPEGRNELGWFIGWVEKGNIFFSFAYNIRQNKINFSQRIPRVKQLLIEANVMHENP
jgi:beta-lactamase class D